MDLQSHLLCVPVLCPKIEPVALPPNRLPLVLPVVPPNRPEEGFVGCPNVPPNAELWPGFAANPPRAKET